MAITWKVMRLILEANGSGKAASAGYPDLLLTEQEAARVVDVSAIPTRDDSKSVARWHGKPLNAVYESKAFFAAMGYELDVFDVATIRGGEILWDLNEPLYPQYRKQYDLVVDSGTCEHIFHIGRAAMNLAEMCKVGGHIVQTMPLNAYNHGFYSVSPTWVMDFYEANGFVIEECFGVSGDQSFPIQFRERFRGIPENSFMLTLVKRAVDAKISVPTQWKYRNNPAQAA